MKVKKITVTDEYIDMYDVYNTERGQFVANGVITHNSAADMSKLALIKIRNDEELIKRQVRTLIPVHDEILIETPLRYAEYVQERFANDMETAAKPVLTIPIKCDVTSAYGWYHNPINIREELKEIYETENQDS